MVGLSVNERKALLVLLKDFTSYYNANSLANEIGISHVGAQKMFRRFEQDGVTVSKKIGKSIVHKIRLDDDYNSKLLSFLLADEANNFRRWREEFRSLSTGNRIVMMFGSALKNYKEARDIDLMLVLPFDQSTDINKAVDEKREILPKKLHVIKLRIEDFQKNLKKKEDVFVDVIKNAVVLYGQDQFVEVLKTVTGF